MLKGEVTMYDDEKPAKKKNKKKAVVVETKEDTEELVETLEIKNVEVEEKSKKIIRLKPDWISILVKFFIFLLVAFLLIFIITKLRNIGNKNTFTNNLEKMREAAYKYYKVDNHRPILEGEQVTMSLGDMISSGLVNELKEKDIVCSKDYSYVSLTKKENDHYDLGVYLTCGGEAKDGIYDVIYGDSISGTTLYELQRTVTTNQKYSCPDGYILDGRYCLGKENTISISANPVYRVTPRREVAASYKASGYHYEYVDAIAITSSDSYRCSSGYELSGSKCLKRETPYYKTTNTYSCPKGSVLEGSLCIYTTSASYSEEQAYCSEGTLINGNECSIHKTYSVKCLSGSYDSSLKSCYKTYTAAKELSDWLFDSKVTYSPKTTLKNTSTVKYEYDYEKDNGYIVYRKYIRKYVSTCDHGDELFGNTCRHYDSSYIQKYCASGYHLNSDGTECYKTVSAKYRSTAGTYTCPDGYRKSGSGSSSYCYKYEQGTKTTSQVPTCPAGYDLTNQQECVRSVDAIKIEGQIIYTCPDGYESSGSGSSVSCFKKTSEEAYYYCKTPGTFLEGNVCVIPERTTFSTYYCPKGYILSGSTCYKTVRDDSILATENATSSSSSETIWSKEKNIDGWTWTGKTKEA